MINKQTIQYKYLLGSQMLGLANCHDEDWVTFIDDTTAAARAEHCQSIPFYKVLIRHFKTNDKIKPDYYQALFMYQLSEGFHNSEEYIFKDFNILEHVETWKLWLKAYVNSKAIEEQVKKDSRIIKWCYHLLYQYYMIKENTHWISEEAKAEVQKIHDLEVPSSYFYELQDLINSL